jgi:hypothetical protein
MGAAALPRRRSQYRRRQKMPASLSPSELVEVSRRIRGVSEYSIVASVPPSIDWSTATYVFSVRYLPRPTVPPSKSTCRMSRPKWSRPRASEIDWVS